VRQAAAREWTLWEMATSKLIPDSKVNIVYLYRSKLRWNS
jgi:hypothetical protein